MHYLINAPASPSGKIKACWKSLKQDNSVNAFHGTGLFLYTRKCNKISGFLKFSGCETLIWLRTLH